MITLKFNAFAISFVTLSLFTFTIQAQSNSCTCDFYELLATQVNTFTKLDSTQTEMMYNSIYNLDYQEYSKWKEESDGISGDGSSTFMEDALGFSGTSVESEEVFNKKRKEYLEKNSSFQTGRKISFEEVITAFPNIGSDYNKCIEICKKQPETGITYKIIEAGEKDIVIQLFKNGEGECTISKFSLLSKSNIVNYDNIVSRYNGKPLNRNQPILIDFERKANEQVILSLNLTNCNPVTIRIPKKNMDTTLYWDFSLHRTDIIKYETLTPLTLNDLHVIAEPRGVVSIDDQNAKTEGGIVYISCVMNIPTGFTMAKLETEFARLEGYVKGSLVGSRCSARVDISYFWGDQKDNFSKDDNLIHRFVMDKTNADCPKTLDRSTYNDIIPNNISQITMVIKFIDNHESREFILRLNGSSVTFSN